MIPLASVLLVFSKTMKLRNRSRKTVGDSIPLSRVSNWGSEPGGFLFTVHRFPGHKATEASGDGSRSALVAVGDDTEGIVSIEGWNGVFIGLELIEGFLKCGGLAGRIF